MDTTTIAIVTLLIIIAIVLYVVAPGIKSGGRDKSGSSQDKKGKGSGNTNEEDERNTVAYKMKALADDINGEV
jgi:hypothetical protein